MSAESISASTQTASPLPRPFYDDWPWGTRTHARALWHWHGSLAQAAPNAEPGAETSLDAFFEKEQQRVLDQRPLRIISDEVRAAAYAACEAHDLPVRLLGAQVAAARRLHGPLRFADAADLDAFSRQWAAAHARLLAGLLDLDRGLRLQYIDEVARGFLFIGRLVRLPQDLEQHDHLFIPESDLEQAGVTVDLLRRGERTEAVRRLLWKQMIRARDALGQAQPLARELSWRHRQRFKRWWYGALELIAEIERCDYDLWSAPVELSTFRRVQIYLQAFFGKAASQ